MSDVYLVFVYEDLSVGDGRGFKPTTSPPASRYLFSTSPITARDACTSETASRPWSYSFCASTITRTLSFVVGLEGSMPRRLYSVSIVAYSEGEIVVA